MLITNELLPDFELLKDTQIFVVDNDLDSRDLYAFLLGRYGAKVTALGSIEDALGALNDCIPTLLICEMRFLGESVYPLIEQVRSLARKSGRAIPILVTSTCSLASLAQQLMAEVEAYLLKPIDPNRLVDEIGNQIMLAKIAHSPSTPTSIANPFLDKRLCGDAFVQHRYPTQVWNDRLLSIG